MGSDVCGTFAVAIATGDFDGDGVADLAISDVMYQDGGGRVFVVFGDAAHNLPWREWLLSNTGLVFTSKTPDRDLGRSLAIGDFDGDGVGDLAISGVFARDGAALDYGGLAIYRGGAAWRAGGLVTIEDRQPDLLVLGQEAGDGFGTPVLARDLDGDGAAELIVASRYAERSAGWMVGRAQLVRGGAGLFANAVRDLAADPAEFSVLGGAENGELGSALAIAPLTAGGAPLLWAGDPMSSPLGRQNAGSALAFEIPSLESVVDLNLDEDAPYRAIAGAELYAGVGSGVGVSFAPAGRGYVWLGAAYGGWNGVDGGGELLILPAQTVAGQAAIDLGEAQLAARFGGEATGDLLGNAVFVGDLDGSGFDDVAVGAWYAEHNNRVDAGKVYLFRDPDFVDDDDDDDDNDDNDDDDDNDNDDDDNDDNDDNDADDDHDDDVQDDDASDDDASDDDSGDDDAGCGC